MKGAGQPCFLSAGVDEAGRGPLAGPVVAAAVILDPKHPISGLADSKKLSEKKRNALYSIITRHSLAYCIVMVEVTEIDQYNILQATLAGMRRAVAGLHLQPDEVLVDGNQLPQDLPCHGRAIVGGDALEPNISAASILAKVSRDQRMIALDRDYADYGFAKHKGYPTASHLEALKRFGPCPQHRRSFAPIRRLLLHSEKCFELAHEGRCLRLPCP